MDGFDEGSLLLLQKAAEVTDFSFNPICITLPLEVGLKLRQARNGALQLVQLLICTLLGLNSVMSYRIAMVEDGLSLLHPQLLYGRYERVVVGIDLVQVLLEQLGVAILGFLHSVSLHSDPIHEFGYTTNEGVPLMALIVPNITDFLHFEALLNQLDGTVRAVVHGLLIVIIRIVVHHPIFGLPLIFFVPFFRLY